MERPIIVQDRDAKGPPWALVPSKYRWDLVEYLAYRRTRVRYTYGATHFCVHFPHLDAAAAQQIVDQWTRSRAGTLPARGMIRGSPREAITASG